MKYTRFLALALGCICFTSISHTQAAIQDTIKCYWNVAQIPSSQIESSLLFKADGTDVLVLQDTSSIPVIKYDRAYKYIPFSTNIVQVPNTQDTGYFNTYDFWNLDSWNGNEIHIGFNTPLQKETFNMQFRYDSNYHIPEYYISENGEDFSRVWPADIPDYTIEKIKIVFTPRNENENIREIIKVNQLAFSNKQTTFGVKNIDTSKALHIYSTNTCKTWAKIEEYLGQEVFPLIAPVFYENTIHAAYNSDSDNDGINDLEDNCTGVKNPEQIDININGVGDACEFDSDNDGVPDEIDTCRNVANPLQLDDDKDGIWNLCDNCMYYNPNQKDTDNNNIWDICDAKKSYLENNDKDKDGIIDFRDNCKEISNPLQEDSDNDGVWDSCDNCKLYKNSSQIDKNENGVWDICEDSDNDGIDGFKDNCLNVANPDQEDSDNDGVWNLCEDDDNDDIEFHRDNCPYDYNPEQKDTDTDGLWDRCDSEDNRLIESNKTIFIFLLLLIVCGFMWGIYVVWKKLK